jgi:TetR/AcrR family transcriptional regulator, regulator of autoinduction and epiphytic fitness
MSVNAVKGNDRTRTRRADKAERTRQAILQAASKLFAAQGFAATTISAIAAEADVAAETVYSRFGNKLALISEILETAIVGNAPRIDVLELPEIAAIRAITDQRAQLARLAHLSRGILERTALAHRILRNSGTADPALAEFVAKDRQRRHRHQTAYIAMLLDNGPLREGMNAADAAAIYGALANPDTYAELTSHRAWSPDHYENWLSQTLTLLLLPPPPRTTAPTN